MDEWSLFEALAFEPDILLNILNYLTLTEINKLESSSKRFEIILDNIRVDTLSLSIVTL